MPRHLTGLSILCAILLCISGGRAQHGGGGRRSGESGSGHHRGFQSDWMGGFSPVRRVPITRPVDLLWPPAIIEQPGYYPPYSPYPEQPAPDAQPAAPDGMGVEVKLDDCVDNAGMAGYSFSQQSIVSCEDSTVDVYLSFTEDGKYYFLVPGDTQIKDVGPRNEIRTIRMIKPGNWSPDHGVTLTAGHVYVVWAYSGDLYLVKVDALWAKHVMFSWLWHSRLSREDAEKFLKDNAGGPSGTTSFAR